MQAVLDRQQYVQKEMKGEMNNLHDLLLSLEGADNKSKNEIENELVNLGESVIPELIGYLQRIKGTVRGVIAMVLIRLGECSVSYLNNAARKNSDFEWMAKYLISEIEAPAKAAA